MARTAGVLLVLLASASIALGSPLCCILGASCCGTKMTAEASAQEEQCCPHCKPERPGKPAPRPCEQKKDCLCKHDAATHGAASAEHAPLVATLDVPAAALPERAANKATATSHRAAPPSPAPRSHPLLL
jgi:hypothetical protein